METDMETDKVVVDGVNAAALNSTTARQWNQWPIASIDPDRLMVDQSAISCGEAHTYG